MHAARLGLVQGLLEGLEAFVDKFEHVTEARGKGLMLGLVLAVLGATQIVSREIEAKTAGAIIVRAFE